MRPVQLHSASLRAPLAAALIALVWAAWVYGPRAINPASVDWLLHGDAAAHHIGVQFFLRDAWRWPLGLFEGFGEAPTGVVFTDGIPWLALAAKAAARAGLWPTGWQYFGLWMLACHAAAAWWGVRLLQALAERLGASESACAARAPAWVAGGLFFTVAPALMMRAYGHEALMAHALVLAALTLALAPADQGWRLKPWLLMVAVAVGVHAYLALMTALIGVSAALAAVARGDVRLPTLLMQGLAAAAVLLGLAWLLGYFAGTAQVSTHGHGLYSANLLTWVDPMAWNDFMRLHQRQAPYVGEWSRWLPARDQATGGQYEGYAWLGTGMLALVAVATVAAFGAAAARFLPLGRPSISKPYTTALGRPASLPWGLLLVCSLLALWALSARITFGAHTLVQFDPPPIVDTLLGVFRASGRFIWPLTYLLMAWAIVQVALLGGAGRPKWGPALVGAALVLQAWDTSPKWLEFHSRFRLGPPGVVSRVQDPRWAEWLQRCPRLEWVADEAPETPPGRWIGPTLAAGLAGAHVLPAPTSHPSPEVQAQRRAHLQALVQGAWRPDTVYVFPGDTPAQPPAHLITTTLDGYATLTAPACGGTER